MTRPWDGYDAYLFDIDGTLLQQQDAVHYFAFCEALTSVAGRPLNLDGVVAHGNVDNGILRDAFALAGVSPETWRPRLPALQRQMCDFVAGHRADLRIEVLPCVIDVLEHLRGRGATLGVATGNLAEIGRLKLTAAGLLDFFQFGGFSDACETRAEVFRAALATALQLTSSTARVCVVGDTPEDVRAARDNGLDVVAVATGIYPFHTLEACQPTLCVRSLAELYDVSV